MNHQTENVTRRECLQWLLMKTGLVFTTAGFTGLPTMPLSKSPITDFEQGEVTSKDGTRIAFLRTGSGPPLVLVYGTASDYTRWRPVLPALGAKFTVYAMERRGRGASGDASSFSFEREFDDVVALVESIGEPVNLLGHSYGGICCLEGLLRTKNIKNLILYEPPLTEGLTRESEQSDARIESLIQQGDPERALLVFTCEIVRKVPATEEELTKLRLDPNWKARVAVAHTIPRERNAVKHYHFLAQRFEAVKTPTLLLTGEKSSQALVTSTKLVAAAIASSRLVVLAGQGHNAMGTAPDVFTTEVIRFLSA